MHVAMAAVSWVSFVEDVLAPPFLENKHKSGIINILVFSINSAAYFLIL